MALRFIGDFNHEFLKDFDNKWNRRRFYADYENDNIESDVLIIYTQTANGNDKGDIEVIPNCADELHYKILDKLYDLIKAGLITKTDTTR